ncbi:hypothetical protein PVAP13_7KG016618, partial [Panicum virgatum]
LSEFDRHPQPPPCGPRVRTRPRRRVRRTVHSLHRFALESAPDFDAASATVQFQWIDVDSPKPARPGASYGPVVGNGHRFIAAGAGKGEQRRRCSG